MTRLPRGKRRVRREETPAGAYEVRFRLEGSYRWLGLIFVVVGLLGFFISLFAAEFMLLFCSGAAMGAGIWIYLQDPREYLVVLPRRDKLQLTRVYGKKIKVRGEWNLKSFVRLETAQYKAKGKGMRCMIILFRADGTAEKVDDRIHDDELLATCAEAAEAAKLEYVDRGRIDKPALATERLADEEPEASTIDA